MNLVFLVSTFILTICYVYCQGISVGDHCTMQGTGAAGQCQLLENCPTAVHGLKNQGITPQTCGFQGHHPIVCCVENVQHPPVTTTTTTKPPPVTSRTEITPKTRAPTVTRVGQKSEQKCIEYTKYSYPASLILNPSSMDFLDECTIAGSEPYELNAAESKEFPHMALLGYDDGSGGKLWLCCGSLISEHFVLTVAHCLFNRLYGDVKYIRLGELVFNYDYDDAEPEDFLIDQAFRYPDYKPPSNYNDIALLKMDRNAKLSTYVRPACLNTNPTLTTTRAVASGWGKKTFNASYSSPELMKVELEYFTQAECNITYRNTIGRRLKYGIIDDIQICAGSHAEMNQDTCQGYSGGPLQIPILEDCMYKIVGITSFGLGCGIANYPAVYTRVSKYIEWIEGIVWP